MKNVNVFVGKLWFIEKCQSSSYGIKLPSYIKFDGFNVKCD